MLPKCPRLSHGECLSAFVCVCLCASVCECVLMCVIWVCSRALKLIRFEGVIPATTARINWFKSIFGISGHARKTNEKPSQESPPKERWHPTHPLGTIPPHTLHCTPRPALFALSHWPTSPIDMEHHQQQRCLLPAASSVVATLTNHIENVLQSLRVQFDLSDSWTHTHTHMQADTPDTPLATQPASGLANMGHKCGRWLPAAAATAAWSTREAHHEGGWGQSM